MDSGRHKRSFSSVKVSYLYSRRVADTTLLDSQSAALDKPCRHNSPPVVVRSANNTGSFPPFDSTLIDSVVACLAKSGSRTADRHHAMLGRGGRGVSRSDSGRSLLEQRACASVRDGGDVPD